MLKWQEKDSTEKKLLYEHTSQHLTWIQLPVSGWDKTVDKANSMPSIFKQSQKKIPFRKFIHVFIRNIQEHRNCEKHHFCVNPISMQCQSFLYKGGFYHNEHWAYSTSLSNLNDWCIGEKEFIVFD